MEAMNFAISRPMNAFCQKLAGSLWLASLFWAGWAQAQVITTFGSGTNQFQIEFVTIGNPGNAADTTGSPNPVGSVGYVYHIGKYEISRDMISKFNASQSLQLTMADLSSSGGNGVNRPATGVSWNEAARFVNWLNTSQGYQAAYNFTTGGFNDNITLWGAGQYSGSNQFRHKDAVYVLPSIDEWYKAAYGSPTGTWYNYPTGSDTAPTKTSGGLLANTAVYGLASTFSPADVNNAGGLSAYGTMGQAGNAWEWMEGAFDGSNNSATEDRERRGGDSTSFTTSTMLLASDRRQRPPGDELSSMGFRIASVPEPSSASLVILGLAAVLARSRRCRGQV
ncbi:MAG: hypothetical protein RLZZ112_1256 [Verrucomicrobiota bacterium]